MKAPIETQIKGRKGLKTEWKIHQWVDRSNDMPPFHDAIVHAAKGRARTYDIQCGSGWAKFDSSDLQDEFTNILLRMI